MIDLLHVPHKDHVFVMRKLVHYRDYRVIADARLGEESLSGRFDNREEV
jgi:hypothetical protein